MEFDYGNVLTRALKLTWKHKSFWLLLMIPALISLVIPATFIAPAFLLDGHESWLTLIIVFWVVLIIFGVIINFLLSTLGITSVMHGILRAERGEDEIPPIDLIRDSIPFFKQALGAVFIIQGSVGALLMVFFLCVLVLSLVTMGLASICLQPIMLLLTPFSFLMVAVMYGALVTIVNEKLGAWESVKRAIYITREHALKFIILLIVVYLGTSILTSIFIVLIMIPAMVGPVLLSAGLKISGSTLTLIAIPLVCILLGATSFFSGISGTFMATTLGIAYSRLSKPNEPEVALSSNLPKDATS